MSRQLVKSDGSNTGECCSTSLKQGKEGEQEVAFSHAGSKDFRHWTPPLHESLLTLEAAAHRAY